MCLSAPPDKSTQDRLLILFAVLAARQLPTARLVLKAQAQPLFIALPAPLATSLKAQASPALSALQPSPAAEPAPTLSPAPLASPIITLMGRAVWLRVVTPQF